MIQYYQQIDKRPVNFNVRLTSMGERLTSMSARMGGKFALLKTFQPKAPANCYKPSRIYLGS